MARFGKVLTAMVTPFRDDGSLDLETAASLAQWLSDNGSDGLVIAGTTGEAPTLTHDEQIDLIGAVVAAVDVPVVAGAGSNDTAAAVELTERAQEAGADGILSVAPYYNRPSQAGLAKHFASVAAATDLPVIIYDIPVRTGRKVDTATLLDLAHGVANIVGVKDAAGDPAETAGLIAQAPDDFEVYSGDDSLTLPLLSVGAVGVIGVATHWAGAEHAEMIAAFEKGDVAAARQINASLMPSYDYETGLAAPNPIPAKAMMRLIGLPVGRCRPPLDVEPDGLIEAAAEVLAGTRLGADD
ncbi:MAG: 4-hydroxy-tetrahydrodipicolinate synthase [Acidimicrobiia bacterium]|nr:4-hydroxy-tetrahydrodipicolinate synthase [Acidimicrobiia bacterium]MXZ84434.1 4-hydroxy-tetrahydrodipicolinate synthase [Acidimicrobiia bacterium]MYE73898.1 4-hydroxy-tetrahydrodipicolinate synthase [Acidimicrobiia bacterium]MYG73762.1 4-hydroxy-tetrahydrodipicolinate synthase [Acidimicrobiia bacterium]MYJ61509.1 4-hydroxy-tetrahydrodipicolinate synthase [Acidimicrobiia bacterium]